MNKELLSQRLDHAKRATEALESEYQATISAIAELTTVEGKQRDLLIAYKSRVSLLQELLTTYDDSKGE